MEKDLKNYELEALEQLILSLSHKKYLAKYIFTFIHQKNAEQIAQFTTLPKTLRAELIDKGFHISKLKTVSVLTDPDKTKKYLFQLPDSSPIESVLLSISNRKTLCISTQSGCAMGCKFCATASLPKTKNLTPAQIIDQLSIVQADTTARIRNIVYMGMGEPLNNYDAVLKSIKILTHPAAADIGTRHITISTCGMVPGIERLANEKIFPRLAVSLNASDDKTRTKLMPVNKKYPLSTLYEAVKQYNRKTKKRVTFEYILIAKINDSAEDARRLVKYLNGLKCNVNLIEYNPHPASCFKSPDKKRIESFAKILFNAGIESTTRYKMGRSIKAACGQLGADFIK